MRTCTLQPLAWRQADGFKLDFRGANGKIFNFVSAPGVCANVKTTDTEFLQGHGKQRASETCLPRVRALYLCTMHRRQT